MTKCYNFVAVHVGVEYTCSLINIEIPSLQIFKAGHSNRYVSIQKYEGYCIF